MDKQINLFRNVFKEEQAARRSRVIGGFFICLIVLSAWAVFDYSKRFEQAAQNELAKVEAALQIEKALIDTLSKAQKDKGKEPDGAMNQLRAIELEQITKDGGSVLLTELESLLSAWSVPGTRFKKVSLENKVIVITGEALTQEAARLALERISSILASKGLVRAMKVEFKATDAVVTFTMTGSLKTGGGT